MRFLRQAFIGLFLASVTLGLIAYAVQTVRGAVQARMADDGRSMPQRERVFAVNVAEMQPSVEVPVMRAFGELRAQRALELRAATSGRVLELSDAFVEGGDVEAGEVLVRIDPADALSARDRMRNDLREAEAESRDATRRLAIARDELAAAEAQAELRERAVQRQRDLSDRGVGTQAALEAAELAAAAAEQAVLARRQALAQAEARIDTVATRTDRASIALAEAERRLAETELVAPFSGSLSEVTVVEGRRVSANEQMARLIDPDALEVSFRLSTNQYARLIAETGELTALPVVVRLESSGVDLTATGRISRDAAAVGAGEVGRRIFATLDATPGFKPGDFVTVEIEELPLADVERLPAAAVAADGSVLLLGPDDRLETASVEVIRRSENDVLIRAPGHWGREVVLARTPLLGAGIKVRPLRQDASATLEVEQPEMVELDAERRARLVAFVEANTTMPDEVKARLLARLAEPRVPAQMIARLESRMGG